MFVALLLALAVISVHWRLTGPNQCRFNSVPAILKRNHPCMDVGAPQQQGLIFNSPISHPLPKKMSWHLSNRLIQDYENSRSSQGLEAEYSAGSCSDGAQSAPSSGTDMHGTFWSPGKTTDVLKPSRSGMTFRPLTDTHGEAVLMSYLEAFPARTFPVQERERESKENEAPCGNTWRELSVKYCRNSSSWKTHQCLWDEDLPSSSLTLPRWGMTRSGVLWERITPPLLTSGTESGSSESWATPTTMDKLPPKSAAALHKEATQARPGRSKPANLRDQVSNSHMWPTPNARDWKDSTYQSSLNALEGGHQATLGRMVHKAMYPTPCASDNRDRGNLGSGAIQRRKEKGKQIMLSQSVSDTSGALNPPWVEWLMGWPLGWTDLKPLAMDKFQSWLKQHGRYFLMGFSKVVFADECHPCDFCEDLICSVCGDHYAECDCIGSTEDNVEYTEINGELYGKRLEDKNETYD